MIFQTPQGFARATGVIEGRRRCLSCQQLFPVCDDEEDEKPCPYCGGTKSTAVVNSGMVKAEAGKL